MHTKKEGVGAFEYRQGREKGLFGCEIWAEESCAALRFQSFVKWLQIRGNRLQEAVTAYKESNES